MDYDERVPASQEETGPVLPRECIPDLERMVLRRRSAGAAIRTEPVTLQFLRSAGESYSICVAGSADGFPTAAEGFGSVPPARRVLRGEPEV